MQQQFDICFQTCLHMHAHTEGGAGKCPLNLSTINGKSGFFFPTHLINDFLFNANSELTERENIFYNNLNDIFIHIHRHKHQQQNVLVLYVQYYMQLRVMQHLLAMVFNPDWMSFQSANWRKLEKQKNTIVCQRLGKLYYVQQKQI